MQQNARKRHALTLPIRGGAQVMQSAVCPEVRLGLDSAVSAIASVTEVELSKDMQVIVTRSTRLLVSSLSTSSSS